MDIWLSWNSSGAGPFWHVQHSIVCVWLGPGTMHVQIGFHATQFWVLSLASHLWGWHVDTWIRTMRRYDFTLSSCEQPMRLQKWASPWSLEPFHQTLDASDFGWTHQSPHIAFSFFLAWWYLKKQSHLHQRLVQHYSWCFAGDTEMHYKQIKQGWLSNSFQAFIVGWGKQRHFFFALFRYENFDCEDSSEDSSEDSGKWMFIPLKMVLIGIDHSSVHVVRRVCCFWPEACSWWNLGRSDDCV